ncbi:MULTISPECIES: hypothetical protein [Mycolicibacterium]|uniref:hypothetical protein n=1 Tax=Mycolicibacterium TaxID=1866885 RepID=UPI00148F7A11|nr:hypothetical protein [Mycolicibacterium fortuitum]
MLGPADTFPAPTHHHTDLLVELDGLPQLVERLVAGTQRPSSRELAGQGASGSHQIVTAEEKVTEALDQLAKLDEVKKAAGSIQKNATKIDGTCTLINSGIHRLLSDALAALTDAGSDSPDSRSAVAS